MRHRSTDHLHELDRSDQRHREQFLVAVIVFACIGGGFALLLMAWAGWWS